MRTWFGLGALAMALALGTLEARAATLDFSGRLLLGLGTFPALVASGGGTATVTDDGSEHLLSLTLPGGTFGPVSSSLPVTVGTLVPSVRFTAVENLAGSFAGLSGGPPGGGTMGLSGTARICLVFDLSCTSAFVPLSFTPVGGAGLGLGGTQTVSGGGVSLTLQHGAWSIGSPFVTIHAPASTVTTPTFPAGFAHGPASATSSTAQASGTLNLVTVTKVITSLTGSTPELAVFGVLDLHFVPEPGTLVLLGLAAAALGSRGRRRRLRR